MDKQILGQDESFAEKTAGRLGRGRRLIIARKHGSATGMICN